MARVRLHRRGHQHVGVDEGRVSGHRGREKAIAIDLSDLATALEDHSDLALYLDTKTREVLPVPDDALLPVPREELVESYRFTLIEPLESRLGWEELRDFTAR